MEYHEIGERFEFYNKTYKVVEGSGTLSDCNRCSLMRLCILTAGDMCCKLSDRSDGRPIYYKRD